MTGTPDQGADLISLVDDRRKRAATRVLDVSLNELADMYVAKELRIRPEYQRLFRWPEEKQSRFIESLILEMPIPPIFVIEEEEGKWVLIDGLQRISTYLHFRGLLEAPELTPPIEKGHRLRLIDCDIITQLNNLYYSELPTALQIRLKRSFLNVQVIRKDTDSKYRYYMFKRLNTGGEPLSAQELRNCTIRLLGDDFNIFIQTLSKEATFATSIAALSEDRRRQMDDVELVLRFFAFKNYFDEFKHDIAEFLTTYMELVTSEAIPFDEESENILFTKTFKFLADTFGEDACVRKVAGRFSGGFSMHHFEAFSIGLARVMPRIDLANATQVARVKAALHELKQDQAFEILTKGGGKNSPGPYRAKLSFVEDKIGAVI